MDIYRFLSRVRKGILMKKYLKMCGNIILFLGLYLAVQILSTVIYAIIYVIGNLGSNANQLVNSFQQTAMKNIYIITSIAAIITLLIYMLIFRKKEKNLWQTCSFKAISSKQFLNIITGTLGLSMFSVACVNLFVTNFPSYNKVQETIASAYGSIFSMISVIILLPIFEEILFRGLISNELKKHLNLPLTIIIQAFIFGIFHGNLLQAIYASFLGAFLGLIYYWTDSIVSSISSHIFYNLLGSLVLPILISLTVKYIYVYIILGLVIIIFSIKPILRGIRENQEG